MRHQLVEIWQANAGGRYIHKRDQHPAPIDPNFTGVGRCLTDARRHLPRSPRSSPGPYPWKNHRNAWRPAHIHFSLFGTDFTQRMVTQMYFPGDPLFALDPIYQSIVDPAARERLVATYDHDVTEHEWCTGYRWDIVLTGSHRTPIEEDVSAVTLVPTPGQTVGPFFGYALPYDGDAELVPPGHPDAVRLHGRVLDGAGAPGARRAGRDLAGRARRRRRPRAGLAAPRRLHLHRLGPRGDRRHRALLVLAPLDARRAAVLRARPSSPAACSTGCSPAPTCPATRRRTTRSWPTVEPERRGTLVADRRRARVRLRHPAAGRGRDRLPRPIRDD